MEYTEHTADMPNRGRTDETPLVSVCMPAYYCADTIAQAIESALIQDVPLEVLVIVDGEDDRMRSVLEQYSREERVRVFRNGERLGAAGSRNRAVSLARGEYVAFLDADDMWAEGKLRRQLDQIRKDKTVLCCTGRELLRPDGSRTGRIIPVREHITYRDLLRQNCINCSSVLLRTEAAVRHPMEHEDSHEDYILWLKLLREYGAASGIPDPLLLYRTGSGGKSGSKWKSAGMTYRVYRYMGFSVPKSVLCFLSYAFHGAAKYLRAEVHARLGKEK